MSQVTFCQRLRTLRAQLHQRGFHLADLVLSLLRIDNAEQLAFFHLVTNLNRQRFQLAAYLSADVNLAQRVKLARREDVLLQFARANNQRLILRHRRIQHLP